ncbi:MAG: hypothetical protein IT287_00195 [Bdellovibrionaceae bacterium]|nr:hypothetical protein [Pseudobdellovibrionaceae bacterium]
MNSFKVLIFVVSILIPNFVFARLADPSEKSFTRPLPKEQHSNIIDQCIQGITVSRPELASQAAKICQRVFGAMSQKPSTSKTFAGRNMADCMSFMRQFSVPVETANFLCPQIVADAKKSLPSQPSNPFDTASNPGSQESGSENSESENSTTIIY